MSKTVRLVLVLAFIVFVGAVIWIVLANRNEKKTASNKSEKVSTPTLISEPVSTSPSTPTATAPTPSAPIAKQSKRYRTVIIEDSVEEISAESWASASASADGSAWAEAHAE